MSNANSLHNHAQNVDNKASVITNEMTPRVSPCARLCSAVMCIYVGNLDQLVCRGRPGFYHRNDAINYESMNNNDWICINHAAAQSRSRVITPDPAW